MLGTKTDKKNIELIKLVAQLRDHIDIHRIIGLNVDSLRNSDISNAFIGYLQKAAQESLAIYFCKIFESSTRNELNSISGIIDSLPPTARSWTEISVFCFREKVWERYGAHRSEVSSQRDIWPLL